MFAIQHALLMADLDPAHVPAVLAYATQPDESLQVLLADARVNRDTWGRLPHRYIRTSADQVIPLNIQNRMIAEADRLTPDNTFAVHTIAGSHFAPISHAAQIAEILTETLNRGLQPDLDLC